MQYLLDTNIVSDIVRRPQGKSVAQLAKVGSDAVFTSIVVAAELRFGAIRRQSATLTTQLELVLGSLRVLPLETPADEFYGEIRCDLERRGLPIGPNDLLIAAHAIAQDATLVTDNEREFARIKDLKIENWLR